LNRLIEQHLPVVLPIFFAAVWLTVTTIQSLLSGWFWLVVRYPNQNGAPILRLRGQSGMMGLRVTMKGILTLSVCPAGLRVGIMRIFGPFCRDFLVPWKDITVTRRTILLWPSAKLQFGTPAAGTLRISKHVADRLARAALAWWPEAGPFPAESRGAIFRRLFAQWALLTGFAAAFFVLAPSTVTPRGVGPPLAVAILFPAIFFGIATINRFFRETR
jgi:hypothetical protein